MAEVGHKKHYLVTGASGLIGSHLVPELLNDYHVTTMGRQKTDQNCAHIYADFSKPLRLPGNTKKLEGVIHLSQSEHYRLFPERAKEIFDVNVNSTIHLLEHARSSGANIFIYASSGGVYGVAGGHCNEDAMIEATGDLGFYSSTKIINEILTSNYQEYYTVVILRFFFVYGKGQNEAMLVPRLRNMIINGEVIHISGAQGLLINPVHVSDAVKSVLAALHLKSHHKINIAGPEVLGLKDICKTLGAQVGRKPELDIKYDSIQERLVGDISLMGKILIKPNVKFNEGIYI